jgi:hypothetical protein
MSLPCGREKCIGKTCGNFNDPASKFFNPKFKAGCKGGDFPPWNWSKWYNEELPKAAERVKKEKEAKGELFMKITVWMRPNEKGEPVMRLDYKYENKDTPMVQNLGNNLLKTLKNLGEVVEDAK